MILKYSCQPYVIIPFAGNSVCKIILINFVGYSVHRIVGLLYSEDHSMFYFHEYVAPYSFTNEYIMYNGSNCR